MYAYLNLELKNEKAALKEALILRSMSKLDLTWRSLFLSFLAISQVNLIFWLRYIINI